MNNKEAIIIDKKHPVVKTTLYVAAFSLVLSLIMELIFVIVGKWNLGVVYSNCLSWGVSVLNFFLMALTVTKATENPESSSVKLKLSQAGRLAMIAAVLVIGFLFDCFNKVALIIPIFFPRISFLFSGMFGVFKDETPRSADPDPESPAESDSSSETETDSDKETEVIQDEGE